MSGERDRPPDGRDATREPVLYFPPMNAVRSESRGDVLVVTLDHPPANALGHAVLRELRDLLPVLAGPGFRAVVLTGAGRFFSAGLDLYEIARLRESPEAEDLASCFDDVVTGLFALDKPVVAAVNGHAIAGGAVLAATADHRFVLSGESKLGLTEILVGVSFPTSALEAVRCSCAGPHLAELLYRGLTYGPEEAVQRRLADEVVTGSVVERAVALAGELGAHRPQAFASSKRALRAEALGRMRAARTSGLDPVWQTWRSEETALAIARFRERALGKKAPAQGM
ncbi:MAG: enoyl-CoA hydratase/isomerase family protein [Deltaproteobacteria bacterium]|nr:enoyl-CoA hydratase/isomerase family protein [Deltaproteobacteria bacterium]